MQPSRRSESGPILFPSSRTAKGALASSLAILLVGFGGCKIDPGGLRSIGQEATNPEGGESAGESTDTERGKPPRRMPSNDPAPSPEPSQTGSGPANPSEPSVPPGAAEPAAPADAGSSTGPMADATPPPIDPAPVPEPSPPPDPVDACTTLPRLPVTFTVRTDVPATDEFTFDDQGQLLAFDGRDLVRIRATAGFEVLYRNLVGNRGGALRTLESGDMFIADYQRDQFFRLAPGENRPSMSRNVRSPMKMVRGPGDTLFVSSANGFIYRIDARTGSQSVVVSGRTEWSALTFDVGYTTLYAGADDEGAIYTLTMSPGGNLGPPRRWIRANDPKAMTTDRCGNIYVVGGRNGAVRRIDAEGRVETVATVDADDLWSVAFGSGQNGWSASSLFVMDYDDRGLYELPVGIEGLPPPPPR